MNHLPFLFLSASLLLIKRCLVCFGYSTQNLRLQHFVNIIKFSSSSLSSATTYEMTGQIIILNDIEYYSKLSHFGPKLCEPAGVAMDTLRMLIQVPFLLFVIHFFLSLSLSLGYHSFVPQFSYIFLFSYALFFLSVSQRLKGPTTRFPHHKIPPYSFLYLHSSSFFFFLLVP